MGVHATLNVAHPEVEVAKVAHAGLKVLRPELNLRRKNKKGQLGAPEAVLEPSRLEG
jgi:hypothetical protein